MNRYRDVFLIGFSHPKASYFLLRRKLQGCGECRKCRSNFRPKESNQRKGGPITADVLRSSHLSGDGKRGFLPLCRRAASLPRPFGLFPTNTAVLDAVNGRKARHCVTSAPKLNIFAASNSNPPYKFALPANQLARFLIGCDGFPVRLPNLANGCCHCCGWR